MHRHPDVGAPGGCAGNCLPESGYREGTGRVVSRCGETVAPELSGR
ncbi:MAG: hypothetical protein QOH57_684, partial [Mycobacterium sp.]|nr:hypothetical protein [Mycobacterium sp.]